MLDPTAPQIPLKVKKLIDRRWLYWLPIVTLHCGGTLPIDERNHYHSRLTRRIHRLTSLLIHPNAITIHNLDDPRWSDDQFAGELLSFILNNLKHTRKNHRARYATTLAILQKEKECLHLVK